MPDQQTERLAPIARDHAVTVVAQCVRDRVEERPQVEFLAQLIACDRRLPAYRAARQAKPAAASLAYVAISPGSPAGLDRSI